MARTRHWNRYRQVAGVLTRHGLGYLVGVLGLERFVPFHRGVLGHARREGPYTEPEHIRLALEELGVTFVKLGQILSTRADLLPPEYQAQFARLQDAAPPIPSEVVAELLQNALGEAPGALFKTFAPNPLAAASIGQAHGATLHDGTEVVVKLRRPDAVEQVEEDLEILRNLSAWADRRWELAQHYDLPGLIEEFAYTLRAELDYLQEGRNAERFAANFAADSSVHIPKIYWDATTSRVITLERIRGIKVSDPEELQAAGLDRSALARRCTDILLKMIFEDGFFHADPHPGNFFIEPGGRIGLIDFGMVGTVDERRRGQLAALLAAITRKDSDTLTDAFLDLGVIRGPIERDVLNRDLERLLADYYDKPLGQMALGPMLQEVFAIGRRHRLQMPASLALLFKTLIMSEGIGAQLDPDFRLPPHLAPYAERLMLEQLSPWRAAQRLTRAGLEAARLGLELPHQFRRLLSQIERGGLQIRMQPTGWEPVLRRLERLTNRLVWAVLVAAFVTATAILLLVYHAFGWHRFASGLLVVGLILSGVLALYLVWSMWHSRRR